MAKTTNVFARVEPELKEQAENVLEQLGIPMSNAIGIFLKQVVLQQGLPFEVKLPVYSKPVALGSLGKEEFYAELKKGHDDFLAGRSKSAEDVFSSFEKEYGL